MICVYHISIEFIYLHIYGAVRFLKRFLQSVCRLVDQKENWHNFLQLKLETSKHDVTVDVTFTQTLRDKVNKCLVENISDNVGSISRDVL